MSVNVISESEVKQKERERENLKKTFILKRPIHSFVGSRIVGFENCIFKQKPKQGRSEQRNT